MPSLQRRNVESRNLERRKFIHHWNSFKAVHLNSIKWLDKISSFLHKIQTETETFMRRPDDHYRFVSSWCKYTIKIKWSWSSIFITLSATHSLNAILLWTCFKKATRVYQRNKMNKLVSNYPHFHDKFTAILTLAVTLFVHMGKRYKEKPSFFIIFIG